MISLQAAAVGAIGYGLGVGAASAWGGVLAAARKSHSSRHTALVSAIAVMVICVGAAALSIRKVMKLEPAMVFPAKRKRWLSISRLTK